MTYNRVIPRDLFNEANLLKCVGRLVMLIEDGMVDWLAYEYNGKEFWIGQDGSDGSLFVHNVQFYISHGDGTKSHLPHYRNLNARDPWPLFVDYDDEAYPVFTDEGEFILKKSDFMEVA